MMEDECKRARVRLVKTIRLDLDLVNKAVNSLHGQGQEDSKVKLVHIVRDPRAMLHSRQKWVQITATEVRATCARLMADAKISAELQRLHTSNYFLVRFEDLASRPLDTALQLYKHVGIATPENLVPWLMAHTNAQKDNGEAGTVRRNSSTHLTNWKNNADVSMYFRKYAPSECMDLLNTFGYDSKS